MKQRKKKSVEYSVNSALNTIYPTYNNVERNEASAVALPTSASSYFDYSHVQEGNYSRSNIGIACEEAKIMNNLPIDRASRYAIIHVHHSLTHYVCKLQGNKRVTEQIS